MEKKVKLTYSKKKYSKEELQKIIDWQESKKQQGKFVFGIYVKNEEYDITMKNVSHIVDKLYFEDDILYAKILILDVDSGKELMKNFKNCDFPLRCKGVTDDDGKYIITDYFGVDAIPLSKERLLERRRNKLERVLYGRSCCKGLVIFANHILE